MKHTSSAALDDILAQLFNSGWNPDQIRCAVEVSLEGCLACATLEREASSCHVSKASPAPSNVKAAAPSGLPLSALSVDTTEHQKLHDLIVIGAGPHALAVVARLLEKRPSALYTDLEHARLSWLRKYRTSRRTTKRTLVQGHGHKWRPDIVVLDKHGRGGWMPRWKTLFAQLHIATLRSPLFFHPGPADVDGLLAYANSNERGSELTDIPGVVGKELSKHARKRLSKASSRLAHEDPINERDRRDYKTPGAQLFHDYCRDDIEKRYDLCDVVTPGEVVDITFGWSSSTLAMEEDVTVELPDKVFVITLKNGRQLFSRAAVLSIGNSGVDNVPEYLRPYVDLKLSRGVQGAAWCHTSVFAHEGFKFPTQELSVKIDAGDEPQLVVIGGGLTSAQVIDLAYRRGIRRMTLLCRGYLKVKPFDFDTTWMDKYQNLNKMIFWREDDHEVRRRMILEGRKGGSVNQPYYKLLRELEARGILNIRTCTTVTDVCYKTLSGWTLSLQGSAGEPDSLTGVDYLVAATGSKASVDDLPLLSHLPPVRTCGGLPVLTQDLQWAQDVPLFVVGALAALELGPAAYNLGGARDGAERVANALGRLWVGRGELSEQKTQWAEEQAERRAGNHGGFFDILDEAEV